MSKDYAVVANEEKEWEEDPHKISNPISSFGDSGRKWNEIHLYSFLPFFQPKSKSNIAQVIKLQETKRKEITNERETTSSSHHHLHWRLRKRLTVLNTVSLMISLSRVLSFLLERLSFLLINWWKSITISLLLFKVFFFLKINLIPANVDVSLKIKKGERKETLLPNNNLVLTSNVIYLLSWLLILWTVCVIVWLSSCQKWCSSLLKMPLFDRTFFSVASSRLSNDVSLHPFFQLWFSNPFVSLREERKSIFLSKKRWCTP